MKLIFYMNFKEGSSNKDIDLVQREFVAALEECDLNCHVLQSIGEHQIVSPGISRVTPATFEAEFSRFFGPAN